MNSKELFAMYIRNFIFGVEDSLVSTVGLVSGIAFSGAEKKTILLTGVILIFVEAFSMAAGSFISERSTEEYIIRRSVPLHYAIMGGLIMFGSYFIAGFIPLFSYFLFDTAFAFFYSIVFSFIALFLLGMLSAKIFHRRLSRGGIRMLLIGGLAILIGILAGKLTTLI